eukprot:9001991-Alexandrium_andersonii.AAC.1
MAMDRGHVRSSVPFRPCSDATSPRPAQVCFCPVSRRLGGRCMMRPRKGRAIQEDSIIQNCSLSSRGRGSWLAA